MSYQIFATRGNAEAIRDAGIGSVKVFKKVHEEGEGEDLLDFIRNNRIGLVINTPTATRRVSLNDEYTIRRTTVEFLIPVITRIETAKALIDAISQNSFDSASRIFR